MKTFGYIQSNLSDNENIANPLPLGIPDYYNLNKDLPSIRDQGSIPKCTSCSITDMLYWRFKVMNDKLKIQDDYIFKQRSDKSLNGMSPKEAFEIIKENGIPSKEGTYKLKVYAKVNSILIAQRSIFVYGPILIALPVYNENISFWKPTGSLIGGHAVTLVGWNDNGFILRNSWGLSYGDSGYSNFPYEDFYKAYECWTIIT